MEEKRIKLPKKYNLINSLSLSNKNILFKESNNIEKSKSNKNIIVKRTNENKLASNGTESTFDTNKKKNKSIHYIYKKNLSRPKGKINISKKNNKNIYSSRKIINKTSKYQNYFYPLSPKYSEEINIIDNTQNLINNKNDSYKNLKKIHGNKEIQEKIKCNTIKNGNNICIINKNTKQDDNNEFINIEDIMLLDEKFNDILTAIQLKSNITNKCFEFINFYNQSSILNKLENYYKNIYAKIIVHNSINLIIFNIILIYHLSFDDISINSCSKYLINIIKMNYNSYLLLCDYISLKVSSKEKDNIWVQKLKIMIKENLKHLDLNNEEYINYLLSKNFNINLDVKESYINHLYELKFYIFQIEKYIKILLKFLDNEKLKIEFIDIFKNFKNISINELNNFFFTKILRVINKNASVGGEASLYNTENDNNKKNEEKTPYISYPNPKKFTLILDLDETLISFKIDKNTKNKGLLKFRPGLDDFLQNVKKYYEIIIFTSSTKKYADPIINEIENNIKYFDYKLYRHHTIICDNYFVKDISRIGRPLDKIIIVDNMPQNYKLQKENGIMIKPYWGEDNYDSALISLGDILIKIASNFDDVRKGIIFYKDDLLNKVSSNFSRKEHKELNNTE